MLVALAELEEDLADTTFRGRPDFLAPNGGWLAESVPENSNPSVDLSVPPGLLMCDSQAVCSSTAQKRFLRL